MDYCIINRLDFKIEYCKLNYNLDLSIVKNKQKGKQLGSG